MKNISAVIFDMDGTIVQTENIWHAASEALLSKSTINIPHEQREEFRQKRHGLAMHETCELIKHYGQLTQSVEELVAEKKVIAHNLYAQGISFIPGFPQFHAQVVQHNLKSGVATNASEMTLDITNKILNLSQFFGEHLYSIAAVNNRCKPRPDIYLYAADKLQVYPENCVAVEDSAHGIAAAKSAGMYCIGINTSGDEYQLRDADVIISAYDNINLIDLWKP
jgi:HAD superfamily hydrolase (TIGR01509 family)